MARAIFGFACLFAALGPSAAAACDPRISVVYEEAAPEDLLTIVNDSASAWRLTKIEIDLVEAQGDLVFDVAAGGRGISQHQSPIGPDLLGPPRLEAEDRRLTLTLKPVGPGGRSVLYLDLDDMSPTGGIYVSPSDLEGARLQAWLDGPRGLTTRLEGALDASAKARLEPPACV